MQLKKEENQKLNKILEILHKNQVRMKLMNGIRFGVYIKLFDKIMNFSINMKLSQKEKIKSHYFFLRVESNF